MRTSSRRRSPLFIGHYIFSALVILTITILIIKQFELSNKLQPRGGSFQLSWSSKISSNKASTKSIIQQNFGQNVPKALRNAEVLVAKLDRFLENLHEDAVRYRNRPKILIVDWTGYYGAFMNVSFREEMDQCQDEFDCRLTGDRDLVNQSHAVMFHLRDLDWDMYGMPKYRSPEQIYVMFSLEPPTLTYFDLHQADNFFNWTMTYRTDSDVWAPYIIFENSTPEVGNAFIAARRAELKYRNPERLIWFSSHCVTSSERELFVEELSRHIPVDIYGSCGTLSCPKPDTECERDILSRYRYYLSFENSHCHQYVTEKFSLYMVRHHLVPIVLNRTVFDGLVDVPSSSFIAASDFPNPKSLARFILNETDEAYLQRFEWTKTVKAEIGFNSPKVHFCQLCRQLSEQFLNNKTYITKERRWLSNPYDWWNTDGKCIDQYVSQYLLPQTNLI